MSLKALCFLLVVLTSFVTSSTASDFEWRHVLNLRAQSDPYRYRYGLMQRFGTNESHVIAILSRVDEPSDAYMVFRLAELSGYASEEVLRIYHERKHRGWNDIASVLGIRLDRHDFLLLREIYPEEHYRPSVYHHYVPQPKHYVAPQRHPQPKPKSYDHPRHERAPIVQERPKAQRHHAQPYAPQKYEAHYQKPLHPHVRHREGDKRHYQR